MVDESPYTETVQLLLRAAQGDSACLGDVLGRYRDRLLLRIRLMMGARARDVAESGDFLQEVFVRVLEQFDRFELRDERSFLRWITMIARNNIRTELRRDREVALESLVSASQHASARAALENAPPSQIVRLEEISLLVDALAELEDDHRRVVEMRNFEQLSFAEVGKQLGRTENAAQLLHARVLLSLRDKLDRAGG